MYRVALWPLAVAVSSALVLSGCLGGGGGGSSSGGGPETGPPGSSFTLSIDVPEAPTVVQAPIRPAERIASALIDLLITPALAELVSGLQPEDFKLKNLGDGEERDITEVVDNGDGTYTVTTAADAGIDSYFEITLSNAPLGVNTGISFRVPATSSTLVATPITTLVTQLLASRVSQLDELEPSEINDLIAEIETLAQDPDIQQALFDAIYTSTSTAELLEALGARLSVVIDEQLDEKATPAITPDLAANAAGSYYSSSANLGVFRGGYLAGGHRTLNVDISTSGNQPSFSVGAGDEFDYEVVNVLGAHSSSEARAWVNDESGSGNLSIDSRGFSFPLVEEVFDYDVESGEIPLCAQGNADCSDREFIAASRALAAGPANSPFNLLVDSTFSIRELRDRNADNALVEQVVNGNLGFVIKKSSVQPNLSGSYGVVELSVENNPLGDGSLELMSFVSEVNFGGNGTLEFCENRESSLFVSLGSVQTHYQSTLYEPAECEDDIPFSLANNGALDLAGELDGWVSPDGLAFVAGKDTPSLQDVLDNDGEPLWVNDAMGERQFVVGVKPAQNADLSGKRYRLLAIGMLAEEGALDMHRFAAGFLQFDSNTSAQLSVALQYQETVANGFGKGSNNDQLDIDLSGSGQVVVDADGRLGLSGSSRLSSQDAGDLASFSANGYVQEGGRVLILNHHIVLSDQDNNPPANMLGMIVGVCTNCD